MREKKDEQTRRVREKKGEQTRRVREKEEEVEEEGKRREWKTCSEVFSLSFPMAWHFYLILSSTSLSIARLRYD